MYRVQENQSPNDLLIFLSLLSYKIIPSIVLFICISRSHSVNSFDIKLFYLSFENYIPFIFFAALFQSSNNVYIFKESKNKVNRLLSNILSLDLNFCSTQWLTSGKVKFLLL